MARIGQVAQQLGINIETIRYYQRMGLIQTPPKPTTGYRHYPSETVARLQFIQRAKALGFSLNDIHQLLSLHQHSCADIEAIAQQKQQDIQDKILLLQQLQASLRDLTQQCRINHRSDQCPILAVLQYPSDPAAES